jgi:hypothetical protein
MERRELLKAGAAVGAAALTSSCVTGRSRASASSATSTVPLPIPHAEMDALVSRMDATLAAMKQASLAHELAPDGLPQELDKGVLAAHEDFLQRSMRSLYVSGIFLDQPEHARAHAGLQERVMQTLPDMDSSVRDSYVLLASLDDEHHTQVREVLRKQPDLGMRVAEVLDARAAEVGISRKRRMQIRAAAVQISTRMNRQHPTAVVEEYLAKTEKVYERHGESKLSRQIAARAGEELFWGRVAQVSTNEATPRSRSATPAKAATAVPEESQPKPGDGALRASAWMFGIGAVSGISGLILVGVGVSVGVFALTLAVVLFIIALITLIAGSSIRAISR